jgi:RimJ/RimL family protein N-acetyltransferase
MGMMQLPIETDRLTLRDFRTEDWVQVHSYARDPEVVRFMVWGPNTEKDTREFIARAMAAAGQQPRTVFELAVLFKPTGALVGAAGLRASGDDPQAAELGYTLHRLAWGQGLGTELARALVDSAFRHLTVRRVWAKCRPENIGSYRVMKKAGLRFEEYLQNDRSVRGQPVDSFLCGITRQEWLRNQP